MHAVCVQTRVAYTPNDQTPAGNRRARLEANLSRGSVLLRALANGSLALAASSGRFRARSSALTPLASPCSARAATRLKASRRALRQPALAAGGASLGRGAHF